jgi:hypothetical protein
MRGYPQSRQHGPFGFRSERIGRSARQLIRPAGPHGGPRFRLNVAPWSLGPMKVVVFALRLLAGARLAHSLISRFAVTFEVADWVGLGSSLTISRLSWRRLSAGRTLPSDCFSLPPVAVLSPAGAPHECVRTAKRA